MITPQEMLKSTWFFAAYHMISNKELRERLIKKGLKLKEIVYLLGYKTPQSGGFEKFIRRLTDEKILYKVRDKDEVIGDFKLYLDMKKLKELFENTWQYKMIYDYESSLTREYYKSIPLPANIKEAK